MIIQYLIVHFQIDIHSNNIETRMRAARNNNNISDEDVDGAFIVDT